MRAVVLESHGGPEVLTIREVPDPVPGTEEVLVEVVATAVNRADILQRMGFYPGPPADHEVPGLEFAGRVAACGARVTDLREGDDVMGIVAGGAYAERLVIHARQAIRVPRGVPVADAAAIPECWITAYDALVLQGGLTSGRVALVHAGASGVGTAAIQLCKALGARVVTTASAGKLDACRALGADVAVDRAEGEFVAAVHELTAGAGADVVLDVVGGEYLDRNIDALRVQGRIIQVGVMGQGVATFTLAKLLPKRATITGTVLRGRPLEEKIAVSQRFAREIVPMFEDGRVRPVIDSRLPLERIADAHVRMEQNANVGKIVIDL